RPAAARRPPSFPTRRSSDLPRAPRGVGLPHRRDALPRGRMTMEFREVLEDRIERLGTRLCLGLDPRPAWHPQGVDLWTHCRDVLEACAPYAAAVKPQLAFFEAEGLAGLQVLFRVLDLAREMEIPVILDGKRGDIGSTAEAYARAWLRGERAGSALTVNPYLGRDSIEPFVQ